MGTFPSDEIPIYEILEDGNSHEWEWSKRRAKASGEIFSGMSLFPTFEKSAVSDQTDVTFFVRNPIY
jgi:hypothetical protein